MWLRHVAYVILICVAMLPVKRHVTMTNSTLRPVNRHGGDSLSLLNQYPTVCPYDMPPYYRKAAYRTTIVLILSRIQHTVELKIVLRHGTSTFPCCEY